ncbi:MAG TPA: hypothetical protein VK436_08215 [Methanocella sp.]|nr:hypothetical protein [Methanocella sp.]
MSSQDKNSFDSYLTGTVQPDSKAAISALQADRQKYRSWNVTKDTRTQLQSDYKSLKATFDSAQNQNAVQMGQARLSQYNDEIADANSQISNLSSKGVDTSEMQSIVSGAESNVVTPLQNAVNSGNADTIRSTMKSTCMCNGAPYSYHLVSRLDLARLQALTEKISDNATKAGYGSQISDINTKLTSVQTTLSQASTNPLPSDQQSQLNNNLKDASEELKSVMQDMKDTTKQSKPTDKAVTTSSQLFFEV